MRNSYKLLGAFAVAGLVATGASAFTATSGIDNTNKFVGGVSQTVSGVHVVSVQYTTSAMPADVTSAVAFHVTEDLLVSPSDVVTATIHGIVTGVTTGTDSIECGHTALGAGAGTDLVCTFGGTALHNVTLLDIVAS